MIRNYVDMDKMSCRTCRELFGSSIGFFYCWIPSDTGMLFVTLTGDFKAKFVNLYFFLLNI